MSNSKSNSNPIYKNKKFNASLYNGPSPVYGPYITPIQLYALQHITREKQMLHELRNKLKNTQKYCKEQLEDIEISIPFCNESNEYYVHAKQYEEKIKVLVNKQEEKVAKLVRECL
jgi:hypothetical protein